MSRPKSEEITRLNYCQYLLSSKTNYTITNYSEHVDHLSHDMEINTLISYYNL